MNYLKKINLNHFLFIFILLFFVFLPTSSVDAAAQCNASQGVTVTSYENMPAYVNSPFSVYEGKAWFNDMTNCQSFCPLIVPGSEYSCTPSTYPPIGVICTNYPFKHNVGTTYNTSLDYCAAGTTDTGGGTYCLPELMGCKSTANGGVITLVEDKPIGGGWCQRTYSCSETKITGSKRTVSPSSCAPEFVGTQPGCLFQEPTGVYCEYYKPGGSYTDTYNCEPPSPPTGVDVKATIWNDGGRSVIFGSQTGDGPLWAYGQAPYKITWGAVGNASSCTLNGSPVSVSGGTVDTYTYPLNTTSLVYTLSCTSSSGDTASNSGLINIPPPPTNGSGSCPSPGNLGSFSWIAPTQSVGGISSWGTFYTRLYELPAWTSLTGSTAWDNNFVGTAKTNFLTTAGISYYWGVQTKLTSSPYSWSDPIGGQIDCVNTSSPDLTPGVITQTAATAGTPQAFSSTITNSGTAATGASFNNFFRVATGAGGTGTVSTISVTQLGALNAGASGTVISSSYTFPSAGTYSVQVCADNNASMVGTITESNEGNNCSAWTTVTVSAAGGGVVNPSCTDATPWYSTGGIWGYRKIFQIDDAKVPATQSNFPVMISLTSDAGLQANARPDGFDILFTNSSGTKLDHEIEKYVSGTGELIAWVKVPSLSSTADTKIYMYYGNPSAINQQNVAGTWDSNYAAVYHYPNGSTLSALDSTINNKNGTISGASATTGKIDGSASFGGSTNMHKITSTITATAQRTWETWFFVNAIDASARRFWEHGNLKDQLFIDSTNLLQFQVGWSGAAAWRIPTPSTGAWHHIAITYNGSSISNDPIYYLDGVAQSVTEVTAPSGTLQTGSATLTIGNRSLNDRAFNGKLDEFRLSNSIRSAQWIATEYNNQSNPAMFYGVSAQCPLPVSTTANISADSTNIPYNTATNITWSSTNATSCSVSPTGWTGLSGTQSTGNLTASKTYTLSCNPGPVSDSVTVNVAPPIGSDYNLCIVKSGQGTVSRNPTGIPDIPNCWTYDEGDDVILTAQIVSGRIFTGWGGDGTSCGRNISCTINMSGNKTVIANFAVDPNYKEF